MVLFLTMKKTEISPIWRFSRLRNPSTRTKTTGQLLAFGGGHLGGVGGDAYATEVEAVGIETGVDGGIAALFNTLPVGDAVKLAQRPAVDCPLLNLLDVDHGWLLSVFTFRG